MRFKYLYGFSEVAGSKNLNRCLFDFYFHELHFKCIYFTSNRTFIFTVIPKQIGFLLSVSEDAAFNGMLPEEVYNHVKDYLVKKTGSYKVNQIWIALDEHLKNLQAEDLRTINEEEILHYLKGSTTLDKNYDPEGLKPFFETWVRNNSSVKVSAHNRRKTAGLFGEKVADFMKKNNVSSRWSAIPTKNSLQFLSVYSDVISNY